MAKFDIHPGDHHTMARSVLAFLIVVLALGVLLLFYNNQDAIIMSGSFQTYFVLSVVGFCLLLTLMYHANKPHHKAPSKKKRR